MLITSLEKISRIITKVYIDYEYAFSLHPKDINNYCLQAGNELSEEVLQELLNKVLEKAKNKAINLLSHMDRTEAQLRDKLKKAYYPEDIIDRVIIYVKEYNYINDERYASIYINYKKDTKSKRALENELTQKGINKQIIDNIISNVYYNNEADEDPEEIAIRKAIYKKVKDLSILSFEEKQKLIASLFRKGFDINKINSILNQ